MRLTCYGTAAAEAIPGLYCSCPVCENARQKKGREIRSRHMSTVDEDIQFDLSPDFFHHIQCHGMDPRKVRHLLITHAHGDHFTPNQLALRRPPFSLTDLPELELIGSATTLERTRQAVEELDKQGLRLTAARYYQPIPLDPCSEVIPLPANHALELGGGTLYLLERAGKKLLYAHDTGPLFEELYDFLSGRNIDAVTMDCTGAFRGAGAHHLRLSSCDEMAARLLATGALKPDGLCIINHFSHGGAASYEDLDAEARRRGWVATYDGIILEI